MLYNNIKYYREQKGMNVLVVVGLRPQNISDTKMALIACTLYFDILCMTLSSVSSLLMNC